MDMYIWAQRQLFRKGTRLCTVSARLVLLGPGPDNLLGKSPGSYAAGGPDARCSTPSAAHGHDFDPAGGAPPAVGRRRCKDPSGAAAAPFFVPFHFELSLLENLVPPRSRGQAPVS